MRLLGGYTVDCPALEDWDLLLRLLRANRPVVHVPVLAGFYRLSPLSMIHDAPNPVRVRRLQRIHAQDGLPRQEDLAAAVYHPATGFLWHSSEASWGEDRQHPGKEPPPSLPGCRGDEPLAERLLVISSAGVRNLGDDAILLATLERLQRIRPGCLPLVFSDGADMPSLGWLGVWGGTCAELAEPGGASWLSRQHIDAVLFSGGGNLNTYWPDLMRWRLAIARAAQAAGIPYLVTGQGVGPLDSPTATLLRPLVAGAVRFSTRDPLSYRLLKEWGMAGPRVVSGLDDALDLASESHDRTLERLHGIGCSRGRPLLGFHARVAEYVAVPRAELVELVQGVDAVAARLGWEVLGIPINDQPWAAEPELLRDLIRSAGPLQAPWRIADPGRDVRRVRSLVRVCGAVIACSFHVALFALEAGIPALLLARSQYYQRKARGLEELLGLPVCFPWHRGTLPNEMIERLRACGLGQALGAGPPFSTSHQEAWLAEALEACRRSEQRELLTA